MIVLDMEQGSHEWHMARLGIPTASQFDKLLTKKTLKPSASATPYLHRLLAEWVLGHPLEDVDSGFIQRGTELEQDAVRFYELQRGLDTRAVGCCLSDDRLSGCSPDRLVGEDGGLEIKCPSPAVHVGYLLHGTDAYKHQIQGALLVTGRAWWDFLSFHPEMPPALIRYERDETYLAALQKALDAFGLRLLEGRQALSALGVVPAHEREKQERSDVERDFDDYFGLEHD